MLQDFLFWFEHAPTSQVTLFSLLILLIIMGIALAVHQKDD